MQNRTTAAARVQDSATTVRAVQGGSTASRPARPAEAPDLGVGIGLRVPHYDEVLERSRSQTLDADWVEVVSENFMIAGGRPRRLLEEVRAEMPVVMHGVSMNLGSVDPLDEAYIEDLSALAARTEPAWISDHLCWTGVGGQNLHDLMPLPACEEAISHVSDRISQVQERLGRRIAIENVSSYLSFEADDMDEWHFLLEIAERADCGILLDVNNVFVSAHNHGFDSMAYLDAIPAERIFQIHLAGHSESGPLLIDTHDHAICDGVWSLYEAVIARTGPISTLVEWDAQLPPLETLLEEVRRARQVIEAVGREDAA